MVWNQRKNMYVRDLVGDFWNYRPNPFIFSPQFLKIQNAQLVHSCMARDGIKV
jgi:hypothetical protein